MSASSAEPGRGRHVPRVDVAPQVPLPEPRVVPVRREVARSPRASMMFEIRRPTNADRRSGGRTASAIVSPTSFESEYDDSGPRLDGLVDRRERRRRVERQAEDRLARGPDDAPHPVRDGRREDVVGRHRVDPERLAVGAEARGRDRREMDDGVDAGERVLRLARGRSGRRRRTAVRRLPSWRASTLSTSCPCSRRSRTTHRPALAAAARDHDPHPLDLLGPKYGAPDAPAASPVPACAAHRPFSGPLKNRTGH